MSVRLLLFFAAVLVMLGCNRTPPVVTDPEKKSQGSEDSVSEPSPAVIGVKIVNRPLTDDEFHEEAKTLRKLPNLVRLDLTDTQVTDACAKDIKGLRGLSLLYLRRTDVGDAGVLELKSLPELRDLDLGGCVHVTDESIATLKTFQTLARLRLDGTSVTGTGVASLRKALPECKVER